MSTCPDNDIHSLYIDGELPEFYRNKYESHVANCPKCKAKLEKMQKIHQVLKTDSDSIKLDQKFMAESFERLQNRMRYSKVILQATEKKSRTFPIIRNIVPYAVAAAAVFAFLIPLSMNNNEVSTELSSFAQLETIKRTSDFSLDQSRIFAQVAEVGYPLQLSQNSTLEPSTFTLSSFTPYLENSMATMASNVSTRSSSAKSLLADDFFSPSFAHGNDSDLKVYVPSYVDISSLNE